MKRRFMISIFIFIFIFIIFMITIYFKSYRNRNKNVIDVIDVCDKLSQDIKKIVFKKEKNFYENNSSIIKDIENDNYIVYTRISNYSDQTYPIIRLFYWLYIDVLGFDKFYNYLGITRYDKNFDIVSQIVVKPNIKNENLSIEDLRVFYMYNNNNNNNNNKIYLVGIARNHSKKHFYPVILDEKYNIYDILDENGKRYYGDKNFVFLNIKNKNFLIKNHNPLEIIEILRIDNDNNKVFTCLFYKNLFDHNIPKFRGSSNYLNISDDRYIGIVHDTNYRYIKRDYFHYFVILNVKDKPYIEKISKPLCLLGNCGIEFVMGMEESFDNKKYIITLGKNDSSSYIIELSKDKVFSYFLS